MKTFSPFFILITLIITLFTGCSEDETINNDSKNNLTEIGLVAISFNGQTRSGYNLSDSTEFKYTNEFSSSFYKMNDQIRIDLNMTTETNPKSTLNIRFTIIESTNEYILTGFYFTHYKILNDTSYVKYTDQAYEYDGDVTNFEFTDGRLNCNFEFIKSYYSIYDETYKMNIKGSVNVTIPEDLD